MLTKAPRLRQQLLVVTRERRGVAADAPPRSENGHKNEEGASDTDRLHLGPAVVAGPRNHRNRTAVHATGLAFQSPHRPGRGSHEGCHRVFVVASGRRAEGASHAAGRGWSALPIGHEGPGRRIRPMPFRHVEGSHGQRLGSRAGTLRLSPSPPGDMPHIVCAIPFPYPLPARSTLPWPRAAPDISALDRSLEIAQPVASEAEPAGPGAGCRAPECSVPEHRGPSGPRQQT